MLTLANFLAGRSQCGPTCGDGVATGSEECDNGADNNDTAYGGCTTQCTWGPFCGDGSGQGPEECDLAGSNGVKLDSQLQPVSDPNDPAGQVFCTTECTIPPGIVY